jgi:hypothetical protein
MSCIHVVVVACAVEMWINLCKSKAGKEISSFMPVEKPVHDMRKRGEPVENMLEHGGISTGSTWVPQRGHVENYVKAISE